MKAETASETYVIEGVISEHESVKIMLYIWDDLPDPDRSCGILAIYGNDRLEKTASNLFYALIEIRKEFEKSGILLNCYGASQNVYPSAMILDMGDARIAYKLEMGKPAQRSDLVSIFETGDDVIPATILDQKSFYEKWLKSLKTET